MAISTQSTNGIPALGSDPEPSTRDAVCGMRITPSNTATARAYQGVTYAFCSSSCADAFDREPARYAPGPARHHEEATTPQLRQVTLPLAEAGRGGRPALEQVLRALPGVARAVANLQAGQLFVAFDPARVTISDLIEGVRTAGFALDGQTTRLKATGLYCAECVSRIEDALSAVPGVLQASMSDGARSGNGWRPLGPSMATTTPWEGCGRQPQPSHVEPAPSRPS